MKRIYIAVSAVASLALAGCGSTVIDGGKVAGLIKSGLQGPPYNVKVTKASCPSDKPAKVGTTFTCTMTLSDGERLPYTITVKSSKGEVHYQPTTMIAAYIENKLTAYLGAKGITVKSVCPRNVPIAAGQTFNCTVTTPEGKSSTAVIGMEPGNSFRLVGLH